MTHATATATAAEHPAFQLISSRSIAALHLEIEQYRHRETGALHYHLSADNAENVFLVGLKTVPTDSRGVAHILEHTVLCGSEHFPVRDPFFMMLRRSLNTFMNAMTSTDWTAYPFASRNRKDFDNLLRVYLDAVFFARLDPLDFAQEGHRLEFEQPDDSSSPLVYKGVVFNEMKGAMSSVTSTLWHTLCHYLYPTTTYHYNSGGDPQHIPDLSYRDLLAFYRRHYHPSNAVFMTFGDIPAHEHQEKFQALALQHFQRQPDCPHVGDEKRYLAPLRVTEHYALEAASSDTANTHIVMGWLLGRNANLKDLLEAHLLSGVLLDNGASPLRMALETTELGTAPSPLCGMDDSNREMVFVCGLEGSEPERGGDLEALVLDVLSDLAEHGIALEQLEAQLHQLELHQREVGGDGYPYGLQLLLQGLGPAIHHGDPAELLDLDPVIHSLREAITDPDYFKQLVRRLLLDNTHRVTLTLVPDTGLAQRRVAAEAARLQQIKSQLDPARAAAIVEHAAKLAARQASQDDESVLPRLTLADVPPSTPQPSGERRDLAGIACHWYSAATNGLSYQQYVLSLPALTPPQRELLPLYTNMVTELGLGDADYLRVQARQAATCGSIHAYTSIRNTVDDVQRQGAYVTLSAKALNRNYAAMNQLMLDTLEAARFDEHARVRELMAQYRASREQAVTGNGHSLAMAAAAASLNPLAAHNQRSSGLAGIKALKALDDGLKEPGALAALCQRLGELHQHLRGAPLQLLTVAEADQRTPLSALLASALPAPRPAGQGLDALEPTDEARFQVWLANTQVNFCARAFPTVPMAHPDAPVLSVLGGFLRNGFLHGAVRERGGAYGGGASQDSNLGAFLFFSYRDPRLQETLADFDASVEWLLTRDHGSDAVEQAILGVIGSLDKTASPAGEAKHHFHNLLFGRSDEHRALFRQRVLAVTVADLKRVAQDYLAPERGAAALLTAPGNRDALQGWIEQHGASVQVL